MSAFHQELLNGCYELTIHEAKKLPKTDNMGFSAGDPIGIVKDCRGNTIMRTKCIRKSTDPKWDETAVVSMVECRGLDFTVVDSDPSGEELMTKKMYDVTDERLRPLLSGKAVSGWFPLAKGEIRLTLKPLFHRTPGSLDVCNTRFPARVGNRITLYQSAHVGCERNYLPELKVYAGEQRGFGNKRHHQQGGQPWHDDDDREGPNRNYEPRNAWEELYYNIVSAKIFVYIVGWSVNVEIPMLRERNIVVPGYESLDGTKIILGDLLQKKAEEGVKVNVMLWREATSSVMMASDGVAGTFSEQTKNWFRQKGGKVNVKTLLREANTTVSLAKVAYSHHQKFVVTDAPSLQGSSAQRRVVAYIGGLDLTKGRFDSPKKPLFNTLGTWHSQDYYQTTFTTQDPKLDCRQPWQDIYAKVEGPVARDILRNFEQRWIKQTHDKWHKELLDISAHRNILPEDDDYVMDPDHPEAWNVQLFRSIDGTSTTDVIGIEGGIHNAYEFAIKRAERFLYIENQYFMGGSKKWSAEVQKKKSSILSRVTSLVAGEEVQAVNRIPLLVMERIARAIREGKRFVAYICIPMFPEGLPESGPMQEILYWQFRTMEMMYRYIKDVLIEVGSGAAPTDYLNFFCLGNREPGTPKRGAGPGRHEKLHQTRRHMIYVHSKLLIADDDYLILGSANINDRSMAGDRDTEIAIGAYQPNYSRDQGVQYPTGQVQAFRLSLWGEHLNEGMTPNSTLYYPESKECVDYVNKRATRAWEDHAGPDLQEQICHLMKYPIRVGIDGSVAPVQSEFPDAPGALIYGADSDTIPDFLTS